MNWINFLPSTFVTKGYAKSCLFDVEKSIYCLIPNSLANFVERKTININKFKKRLSKKELIIFDEYIDFLSQNNFIILSQEKINFKYFKNSFIDIPYSIHNLLIDSFNSNDLLYKINKVNIIPYSIQIRFFYSPGLNQIKKTIDILKIKNFMNVEFVLNINKTITDYKLIYNNNDFISKIYIMGSEINYTEIENAIYYVKNKINNVNQCGIIKETLFRTNIYSVIQSKNCNSCLANKISIDKDGNIKNCPSMVENYGNIKNTTLEDVLKNPNFKKYWNITKEQIEICKDCEFRHICTDCRAYIEEPKNIYSKPLKCGYNPYTNIWEEWSTNPLKNKTIEYYGMEGLIKK